MDLMTIIDMVKQALGPIFIAGLQVTIPLTIVSFILALIIAGITAIARISNSRLLRFVFATYVWIFRGTPLIVQLFIAYFGLASLGLTLDAWTAAVLTFGLNSGAYASEAIRAAILSISNGQWDAARSLGMSRLKILQRVIAPQAFRIALPPLFNELISLVKGTSLAASITLVEMFLVSQRVAARTYQPLIMYIVVAFFYLMISTILVGIQSYLEKRTSKHVGGNTHA